MGDFHGAVVPDGQVNEQDQQQQIQALKEKLEAKDVIIGNFFAVNYDPTKTKPDVSSIVAKFLTCQQDRKASLQSVSNLTSHLRTVKKNL